MMNANEIKSLLNTIFFEDEYCITEDEKNKEKFFIKAYFKHLNSHYHMITIQKKFVLDRVVVWEMVWTLPYDRKYYLEIPETDVKSFLMMSKERLKDILLIKELNGNLISDMDNMRKGSLILIRDFKLNQIL